MTPATEDMEKLISDLEYAELTESFPPRAFVHRRAINALRSLSAENARLRERLAKAERVMDKIAKTPMFSPGGIEMRNLARTWKEQGDG